MSISRIIRKRLLIPLGLLVALVAAGTAIGIPAAHAQNGAHSWPVLGAVTRGFSPPSDFYGSGHRGIDIASPAGTTVRAAAAGTVSWIGRINGIQMVSISHPDGTRTTYQPVAAGLSVGVSVDSGTAIGTLEAGHADQDCLHFGVRSGTDYLDPVQWLGDLRAAEKVRLLPSDSKLPARPSATPGSGNPGNLPVSGPITSPFGNRVHPISGSYKFHKGVDIGAPCGTPVQTPWAGTVSLSAVSASAGQWIIINSPGGITATYMHLSKRLVANGDQVAPGQVIGLSGTTGNSTGCHLHFQTTLNGDLVDPLTLLKD
jgi:murein DD-endopeptidase MepM/ murein hydrolase activator NlpD